MWAHQYLDYTTINYQFTQFETLGALFTDSISHQNVDQNNNGTFDTVIINVPLEIPLPDTYQVEGNLYDADSNFIGHAVWNGSETAAALEFDITNTEPPYLLENLIIG